MQVRMSFREIVIHHKRVLDSLERKRRIVLFRIGAYALKTMRRSMRYSTRRSAPGRPPHAHKTGSAGPLLRQLSAFGVDQAGQSAVAGPIEITSPTEPITALTVPELIDQGGRALIYAGPGQKVEANIMPRPFTDPVYTDGGRRFEQLIEEVPL